MGLVMHIICRFPSPTGVTLTGKPVGVACLGRGVVCWARGVVCKGVTLTEKPADVLRWGRGVVCRSRGVVCRRRGVVCRGRGREGAKRTGKPACAVRSGEPLVCAAAAQTPTASAEEV